VQFESLNPAKEQPKDKPQIGRVDVNVSAETPSVVSKSQYALLKNVSPGRVSQWISEGKIEPDALIGDGRGARIDVAKADAYLRRKLDIGQRFGNGLSTRLDTQAPIGDASGPTIAPRAPGDPVEEQIKLEKLEGLQRENRKRAEEEAARAGRYVDSEQAASQMAKVALQMLSVFEGSLSELATSIAARFQVPQRDVLHLLRGEFRSLRARAAINMKEASLALPSTIEDEIAPVE
jgi:hypothetical protein